MKPKTPFRTSLAALALLGLAGCDSIGDGSTIVSLQIESTVGTTESPFMLTQCLRDQLVAVATFTDGTRANYSARVSWATSDASVVDVSNGNIKSRIIDDGVFVDSSFGLSPGVLVPK